METLESADRIVLLYGISVLIKIVLKRGMK